MGDHVLLTFVRTKEERQTETAVRHWISTARNHFKASRGCVGPLHALVLHVTNGCQSECMGCEHRGPPDKHEISPARCQELVREAQALGCQEVILTGGEPLVRHDIEELLRQVSATGINVCLLTNGLALEKLAPTVARTCDRVIVSLDGHDDSSYRQTRGVNGFSAVMRGVASLHQCAKTSLRKCQIFGRTTVHPTNIPHLVSIANVARKHGFEGISFLAADRTHQQAFARNDDWQVASDPLTAEQRAELQSQLEGLEHLRATGFVTDSKLALNRILDHYDGQYESPRCNAPWRSVVVSADQTMQPCFFLPPYGTAKNGLKRGFKQAKPMLKQLKIKHNPTCHRCVCWASLS
jgi:MoaA/NifB/PqqE/SkfB family radical SAM enzyme